MLLQFPYLGLTPLYKLRREKYEKMNRQRLKFYHSNRTTFSSHQEIDQIPV